MLSLFLIVFLSSIPICQCTVVSPETAGRARSLYIPIDQPGVYDIQFPSALGVDDPGVRKIDLANQPIRTRRPTPGEQLPPARRYPSAATISTASRPLPLQAYSSYRYATDTASQRPRNGQLQHPQYRQDARPYPSRRYRGGPRRFRLLIGDDAVSIPRGLPLKVDVDHDFELRLDHGVEFHGVVNAGKVLVASIRGSMLVAIPSQNPRYSQVGKLMTVLGVRDSELKRHDVMLGWTLAEFQKPVFCFLHGKLWYAGKCQALGGTESFSLKVDWVE